MFPAILLRVDLTGKPEDEADCQNTKARCTYLEIRVDLEHMVDMQDRTNIVLEAEQLNTVASYEVSVFILFQCIFSRLGRVRTGIDCLTHPVSMTQIPTGNAYISSCLVHSGVSIKASLGSWSEISQGN